MAIVSIWVYVSRISLDFSQVVNLTIQTLVQLSLKEQSLMTSFAKDLLDELQLLAYNS